MAGKMSAHDKVTLAKEYCLCRGIPYRVTGGVLGQFILGTKETGRDVIFSIYNVPWSEIIPTIDKMVRYDYFGKFECMA